MKAYEGYFNYWWDESTGKIWLEVDKLDQEFLYVNSLPAGVGSNDIGLDRGQLGGEQVVKFMKSGPKILLIQPNYDYRAISDNDDERKSVQEAFAQSVLFGFKVAKTTGGNRHLIDLTEFLLRDAHQVSQRLARTKQGSYKVDKSRSAIYLDRCKNFPKNTELEAMITFTGQPKGGYIRSVVPNAAAVTVRMHHSFIELPDDDYEPRLMDPRSGFNSISYYDYATPIDQSLEKQFIARHRLKKKNPAAAVSEAVEPIIYYLDRGAPEPVRSALLDGARWWNQAFEAAGYKDAFQVKILPEGADPMDVRYNLIQWVHRSTRGWSYGASVRDPRTGEIIKGHVSLGSLRVRQDYLIAQGLLQPFEEGKEPDPRMLEMALARLRQLSAHEVGHTIGLAHNFAASTNDRASVMDYPHPYIELNDDGSLNFAKAYDDKIGEWDKRTILYGYQDFPKGTDEAKALQEIIEKSLDMGLRYISDRDARPAGGAHPTAHLWDNGASPIDELQRLLKVRETALDKFGEKNIPMHSPMSQLEEVLVPLYLAHRYQVEAVAKLIGGVEYSYAMRGDGQTIAKMLSPTLQNEAVDALLQTIHADRLTIPESVLGLLPPKAYGYSRGRESFKIRTGLTFDPIAAAESAANNTLTFLLLHERAARLVEQKARDNNMPGLDGVIDKLMAASFKTAKGDDLTAEVGRTTDRLVLQHLIGLAANENAMGQVRAISLQKINELETWLKKQAPLNAYAKCAFWLSLRGA
ncbi:MAG: zinc-dependent metalloprotease, partial [Bacteroidota bacterium]